MALDLLKSSRLSRVYRVLNWTGRSCFHSHHALFGSKPGKSRHTRAPNSAFASDKGSASSKYCYAVIKRMFIGIHLCSSLAGHTTKRWYDNRYLSMLAWSGHLNYIFWSLTKLWRYRHWHLSLLVATPWQRNTSLTISKQSWHRQSTNPLCFRNRLLIPPFIVWLTYYSCRRHAFINRSSAAAPSAEDYTDITGTRLFYFIYTCWFPGHLMLEIPNVIRVLRL